MKITGNTYNKYTVARFKCSLLIAGESKGGAFYVNIDTLSEVTTLAQRITLSEKIINIYQKERNSVEMESDWGMLIIDIL